MVWAAYKTQGIDLERKKVSGPGVTPRDIFYGGQVNTIVRLLLKNT